MTVQRALPTPVRSRKRLLAFRLLAFGAVGVLCFIILEFGVRLLAPQPVSWLAIYHNDGRLPFFTLQPDAHARLDTGETRWEVWTDAAGRRHDPARTIAGRPEALWLGDSFVFGHGVDYGQTWIGLIEAAEDARHRHINAGVAGHGPSQYRAILADVMPTLPALELVCVATFLGNDFHDTIWEKDLPMATGILDDDGGFKSSLKKSLHSYRLISRVLHALAGEKSGQQYALVDLYTPANWRNEPLLTAVDRYREAFADIAELCASRSLPLVVFVIPTPAMVDAYRSLGPADSTEVADERSTLRRALDLLAGLGLRVVDLTPALAAQPSVETYFRYDGHLTPLGHELVRDAMLRAVPEFRR